ncbi:MAG: ABC transporter ATP-binding protein, partial [Thermoplasmata archaeon]
RSVPGSMAAGVQAHSGDVIVASDLTRSYRGAPPAVERLSLTIRRGEIFALLGPNGAGKTTTLRMLSALIQPTGGHVEVLGLDTRDPRRLDEIHNSLGILPEVTGLYESLTAYRNLQFFGRLHGLSEATIYERSRALLTSFEIWERRNDKIETFSKGMKQKVAVVRAMLHDPPCLILDEPVSGLDPEAAKTLRDFILEQRRCGKTIVLSTHNLDDADRLSDRVAILRSRLLALDTPARLKEQLFDRVVAIELARPGVGAVEVARAAGAQAAKLEGRRLILDLPDAEGMLPDLNERLIQAGYRIIYVQPVVRTLEEVYLKLLESEARPSE